MKIRISLLLIIFSTFMILKPAFGAVGRITFWTMEVEKDRLDIQRDIAQDFTKKTGIHVDVIPVQEDLLTEKVTAAYAAKSLPDVIFHPVDLTMGWAKAGILDDQVAGEVIQALGKETFGKSSLCFARTPVGYAAIPIDGWGQLLLFRKDLFQKNGLPTPNHWDKILQAARALNNPPLMWGFEAPTDPGQVYTQQVFEHLALSNGVTLTGQTGGVDLNTLKMIQTLEFYKALTRFTPPGNVNWLHTRMDYLSGRTAMIMWSPFILDELSGLRRDQPVIPDIMHGSPGFLAKNTGFVSIICGPTGAARYGQINYLGITRDANGNAAKRWVEYLLSEGYMHWLSMAAEGKLPVRTGTRDNPKLFIDKWMGLEFGGTTRARISQFYGKEAVSIIMAGVKEMDRWGFEEGKGGLISKIYGTKAIPEILKKFLDKELTAQGAARAMNAKVRSLE